MRSETTFGEFLLACRKAADNPAMPLDPVLQRRGVAAGASEAVPSDGGFLSGRRSHAGID